MRTIEISTTQNVTIEYQLASVQARIVSYCLDVFAIIILLIIVQILIGFSGAGMTQEYIRQALVACVIFFYTPLMEIFGNGRSLGKRAMRLKVVRVDGMEATVSDYLIRWTFRMVDIYFSLGSIACLLVSSTHHGQRLGDLVANTTVIHLRDRSSLSLRDIQQIKTRDNYEPQFPAIRSASEADMLLVKNVLDRYKRYTNASHRIALAKTAEVMRQRMGVDIVRDPEAFLRTLINDYIVLTR